MNARAAGVVNHERFAALPDLGGEDEAFQQLAFLRNGEKDRAEHLPVRVGNRRVGGEMPDVFQIFAPEIGFPFQQGGDGGIMRVIRMFFGEKRANLAAAVIGLNIAGNPQQIARLIHALKNHACHVERALEVIHNRDRLTRRILPLKRRRAEHQRRQRDRAFCAGHLVRGFPCHGRKRIGRRRAVAGGHDVFRDAQAAFDFFAQIVILDIAEFQQPFECPGGLAFHRLLRLAGR